MDIAQFHKLRQEVLSVEGHVIGIAKKVSKQVRRLPQDNTLLVGEVAEFHGEEVMHFAERYGITIPEEAADNYFAQVYGNMSAEFRMAQAQTYESNASSRGNVVPLVSEHFPLLGAPYVLNPGKPVPEGMEIPARWAIVHPTLSIESLSQDLDRIAEESFAEMAAAIAGGADRAKVIDIHRQKIYDWVEEKCLNVDRLRVDRYVGEIYRCGVFVPSKVDEITEDDRKNGRITYRERIHTGCKVTSLLTDEFPIIEHKIQDAA